MFSIHAAMIYLMIWTSPASSHRTEAKFRMDDMLLAEFMKMDAFERMDRDGDGIITRPEWEAGELSFAELEEEGLEDEHGNIEQEQDSATACCKGGSCHRKKCCRGYHK